jgi:hypothetical protein
MERKIGPDDRIRAGGKSLTVEEYLNRKGGDRAAALRGLLEAIRSGSVTVEAGEREPAASEPHREPETTAPAPPTEPDMSAAPAIDLAALDAMIAKHVAAIQLPPINVQVAAPVINMPAQEPPTVNVQVDAPQISVSPPAVTVDVDAREGTSRTTVEEWTPEGRIKSFVKTPVADAAE